MATKVSVSLKLHIDTKSQKVLFAEAGKEFVDFLFNLLTLPLGTISKFLTKDEMVGCIGDLYDSVIRLKASLFLPSQVKEALLTPNKPEYTKQVPPFSIPVQDKQVQIFYTCSKVDKHLAQLCITEDGMTFCKARVGSMYCGQSMTKVVQIISEPMNAAGPGGYVKDEVAFLVTDHLAVEPLTAAAIVSLIKDVSELEERVVQLDQKKGLKLLKASLQSKSVLASVFLSDLQA